MKKQSFMEKLVKKDYNNDVSNFGRKFSDKIESVFSKGFDYLFRYIDSQNKK